MRADASSIVVLSGAGRNSGGRSGRGARQRALRVDLEIVADQRGLEVQVHRDLEEVRLGDWSKGEFRRRAAAGDPEWIAWSRTGRWDGIPGAEGDAVFRARLAAVIAPLVEAHRGQCIAVVAHGGSIGAYVADLFGIHRSLWLTVENTSVTAVRVGLHGSMVVAANDTHHLYDPVLGQS